MYNFTRLKTVAAVAAILVASATTAASANPFNPFEALFGPQREPVAAPAYANPQDDARPAPSSSIPRTRTFTWCCPAARPCATALASAAKASLGPA